MTAKSEAEGCALVDLAHARAGGAPALQRPRPLKRQGIAAFRLEEVDFKSQNQPVEGALEPRLRPMVLPNGLLT